MSRTSTESQHGQPAGGVRRARRLAAALLLPARDDGGATPSARRKVPAWKAWLLAAWMAVAAAAYLAHMLGLLE